MPETNTLSPVMKEIALSIRARNPILYILTHEEERFLNQFYEQIIQGSETGEKKSIWDMYVWSSYRGLLPYLSTKDLEPKTPAGLENTASLSKALQVISNMKLSKDRSGAIYILLDANGHLSQNIPRQIRDMVPFLGSRTPKGISAAQAKNQIIGPKTLIILTGQLSYGPNLSKSGLEPTLEKYIKVIEYSLPSKEEITTTVSKTIDAIKAKPGRTNININFSKEEIGQVVSAVQGLTLHEIDKALFASIADKHTLSVDKLLEEKKQIIKRSDILEYIDVKPSFEEVGGLDAAKAYFEFYGDQFSPEARTFGLEALRGVLLLGCPGVGKSLLAKAVASLWKLPLLRLDVGKVMTGLVGGSEGRMRDALNQASSMAPAILWIDEIEKALSGTKSSNMSDSGTLSRVFGTLLTAMEEGLKDLTILATANDISQVPPELIRRFSEVFFADLPEPEERVEIFNIHMKKRGRDPVVLKIDIDKVVAASHMFTGSEIERSVQEGIARSWRDGKRKLKTEDILGALGDTKPISRVMGEKINEIRTWARDRARYASSLAAAAHGAGNQKITTSTGKELKVDEAFQDLDEIKTSKERYEESKENSIVNDLLDDLN